MIRVAPDQGLERLGRGPPVFESVLGDTRPVPRLNRVGGLGKLCDQRIEADEGIAEFASPKQGQGAVVCASLHRIDRKVLSIDCDLNGFETLNPRIHLGVLVAQTPLGRCKFVRLKFEFAAQTFDLTTEFLNPVGQGELTATGGFETLESCREVFESTCRVPIESIDPGPKV
jgi:hypothetical protein